MLDLYGIQVTFGGLRAVDGVTLHIAPGSRHALIGANGAGKSTLLHVAAGAVRPSAGRVVLGDRDVTAWAPHRRAQAGIGRTFQQPALLRKESCLSNVAAAVWRRDGGGFALLTRPARRRAVTDEAYRRLAEVGLTGRATKPAGQLSHAQQRQLELAVALAGRPDLLLLDEPAAGLARPDLARLSELIRDLPAELTVLLVDHDLDLVFDLATTVTVLDRGRVVLTAPPAEVWADARAAEVYLGPTLPPISTLDAGSDSDRPAGAGTGPVPRFAIGSVTVPAPAGGYAPGSDSGFRSGSDVNSGSGAGFVNGHRHGSVNGHRPGRGARFPDAGRGSGLGPDFGPGADTWSGADSWPGPESWPGADPWPGSDPWPGVDPWPGSDSWPGSGGLGPGSGGSGPGSGGFGPGSGGFRPGSGGSGPGSGGLEPGSGGFGPADEGGDPW